ncbi:unnamed protein product [Heligmosomoides polygyrus]|uniref:NCD1 domain-containing protein n=1 Tax=Heligmosomoides polygyrus TaxID=6339 RepID=A0A183GFD0_HELPZ|nr:unnamed protein product [Heligmosomoides polygyrus]
MRIQTASTTTRTSRTRGVSQMYRFLSFILVSLLHTELLYYIIFTTPKPLAPPTSISEWQLLAVLQRANLVQYYDMFISQGGDDINQIMQCDEGEFLEIMSLVGMLSKPLHVRRLQRALTEFSKDQTTFNLAAIQHIGPPPVSPYALGGPDMSFLMPGTASSLSTRKVRKLIQGKRTLTYSSSGYSKSLCIQVSSTISSRSTVPRI